MLNILFPRVCAGCKNELLKAEEFICAQCLHSLPLACYHRNDDPFMKNIFYGRFAVENATALILFQKQGVTQEILHNLKYKGQKGISAFFGKWLGSELIEQENYQNLDLVIPVPLHKQKLRKRGYNQVEGFGREIALALNIPYRDDILLKITKTSSQVFKKRFSRIGGEEIFAVADSSHLFSKHVLLVDDIITTGATLENCAVQLLKNTNAKVSLATIAIA